MRRRQHPLAQIGVAAQLFRQGPKVRREPVNGGLFRLDPLQQPAGGAEMGEAHLAVIEQPRLAVRRQRRGHVHHVHIGVVRRQFRQGDIGEAKAVAVSHETAVRKAQGLDRRLRQIVDQDRRGRHGAQLLDEPPGRLEEQGRRGLAPRGIHGVRDRVASPQGAYQHQIVAAVDGHGDVVGKACGDRQVQPPPTPFLAQEVLLHLHVAVTEQQHVQPAAGGCQSVHGCRLRHRPVVFRAAAAGPAPGVQPCDRVPAIGGAQLGGQGLQLGLGRLVGQHLPLQQGGQQGRPQALLEQGLGNLEQLDDLGEIGVHHPAHLVDRMEDQHASVADRGQMDKP